jgi:hypothetical protein
MMNEKRGGWDVELGLRIEANHVNLWIRTFTRNDKTT